MRKIESKSLKGHKYLRKVFKRYLEILYSFLNALLMNGPFNGHVATSEGLRADPAKVRAILELPRPENVSGVQRILGIVQYLSKFMP